MSPERNERSAANDLGEEEVEIEESVVGAKVNEEDISDIIDDEKQKKTRSVMKKMKWPDFIVDDEVKDVYNVQSRRNGNKKKPGRVREPTIFFETIRSKKPKVKDEFEPIVNSDKYLTKEDDNIRKTDILERMQVHQIEAIVRPARGSHSRMRRRNTSTASMMVWYLQYENTWIAIAGRDRVQRPWYSDRFSSAIGLIQGVRSATWFSSTTLAQRHSLQRDQQNQAEPADLLDSVGHAEVNGAELVLLS
nr:transcription elongation factor SPT6 homolog [Tanacetum cinerariifolium]